jgi:hypothetical protein
MNLSAIQAADVKAVREANRGSGALASTVARVLAYPFKTTPGYVAEVTTRLDALVAEGHLTKTGSRYSI